MAGFENGGMFSELLKNESIHKVISRVAEIEQEDANACAQCGGEAPNNVQGWGRIDLEETLYPSNRAVHLEDWIPFSLGSDFIISVETTNTAPLEVQLVWIDHPGTEGMGRAIVNDLDLVVANETAGGTWRGNGVREGDRVNTVESVRIDSAAPGRYFVHVKGVTVPYDSEEGGAAALYVRGAFAAEQEAEGAKGIVPLCRRTQFPLLGDELYGSTIPFGEQFEDVRERAIALHSRELSFVDFLLKERVTLHAPLYSAWRDWVDVPEGETFVEEMFLTPRPFTTKIFGNDSDSPTLPRSGVKES